MAGKVMRSTKEGSKCTDCGAEIKVGDPIAYYGPRYIYGLTCHKGEKSERFLKEFLEREARETAAKEKEEGELELSVTTRGALLRYAELMEKGRRGEYGGAHPTLSLCEDLINLLEGLCDLWGVDTKGEGGGK